MSKNASVALVILSILSLAGCDLLGKAPEPLNQVYTGTIEQGDKRIEQDNSLYDEYPVELGEGWTLEATMTSEAFDTYILVIGPDGSKVTENDDDATLGGEGRNSRVQYTATKAGTYLVFANAYQAGEMGPYSLKVISAGPAK